MSSPVVKPEFAPSRPVPPASCYLLTGRGSRQTRTLLVVQQRQSPTPDDAGRVQVRVFRMAAGHALECPGVPGGGIDMPAGRTGPAGVAGTDRDHPVRLVLQHPAQGSPAGGKNLPVQPGLCLYLPPRLFGRSLRAPRHAKRLQVLDDDGAGRVRKPAAGPVMPVAAHRRDPPLGPAQPGAGVTARRLEPRLWRASRRWWRRFRASSRRACCPSLTATWPVFMSMPIARSLSLHTRAAIS